MLALSLGNPAKATTFGGKFPNSTIPFFYGGAHRYYGNVWQGAYNWRSLTHANVIDWYAPLVVRIDVVDVYDSSTAWAWTYLPCSTCTYSKNTVYMNQRTLDPENDFTRTKAATHELGHAIGLAHAPSGQTSIMQQGHLPFNTPRIYDINDVNSLY